MMHPKKWRWKMFDWIGGRKNFFALLFVVLVTVTMFLGFLSGDRWVKALEWALVVYLGANAAKAIPDALGRK
jgi:hypothetical protein